MSRKITNKGRSSRDARHVRLYYWMMQSLAWQVLRPADRAVYIQLQMRYNGTNNGFLAFSVRDAARECNISNSTAGRCFINLQNKGFIVISTPSSFGQKLRKATEYRLTVCSCDKTGELATKDFMKWVEVVSKAKEIPDHGTRVEPDSVRDETISLH
ncbi:MAG: hypothetical protein JKY49_18805 [Cohaesibacteraceae bacterium]|nr:hypothetical protein [Cohaesibacteraceae bacterium]